MLDKAQYVEIKSFHWIAKNKRKMKLFKVSLIIVPKYIKDLETSQVNDNARTLQRKLQNITITVRNKGRPK